MFDPLGLFKNRSRMLRLKMEDSDAEYRSLGCSVTGDTANAPIARYLLQACDDESTVELELAKDRANNFIIYAYRLIEEKCFCPGLYAMLGTEAIGFASDNDAHRDDTRYRRILYRDEQVESCKYLCDPQEMPEHPAALGYTKDGNGNWYMMMTRSGGRLKQFDNRTERRCWEYESPRGKRLLFELEEETRQLYIYRGERLQRHHIRIVTSRMPLHTQAPQREQTTPA